MAVPKRKHSNARSGSRRAHHGLKPLQTQACPKCGKANLSHVICENCGHYQGRKMVETEV